MSFFRSETMSYYEIIIPRESAWEVFNELGKLSIIQMEDQNIEEAHINRHFYPMIRRADEALLKISSFEALMVKFKIKNLTSRNPKQFLEKVQEYGLEMNISDNKWFEIIEQSLDEKYGILQNKIFYKALLMEQLQNLEKLQLKKNNLFEHKAVLIKTKEVLGTQYYNRGRNIAINPQFGTVEQSNIQSSAFNLNYMVGVVDRYDAIRFKRMVFRASKGNAWIALSDIEYTRVDVTLEHKEKDENETNDDKKRTVFIIVYQGGAQDFLKSKLNRICDSFQCSKFGLPEDPNQLIPQSVEIDHQLDESDSILNLTNQKIKEILLEYAAIQPNSKVSLLEMSKLLIIKDKAIFTNLNTLNLKQTIYAGFFWAPKSNEPELHHALHKLSQIKQNVSVGQIIEIIPPSRKLVPTYFKINDFTFAFQEIVNTYGIPRYKEVNPGMFAVMFFPFMFGVMFGDIGHGGILLVVALLLVKNYETLKKDPALAGLLKARFLFLLMGICAFYCGFIYNDFMSLTFNLFGSCFKEIEGTHETEWIEGCVYPIGFDPKWFIAGNELAFFNSFKMKFAIIFGVSQMMFGILLKGANNVYFRNYLDFFCEFIPQIIFLTVTFGYMSLLIILKWAQSWEGKTDIAPSIINMMINIPLMAGSTDNQPLYDQETQETIQYYILIVSFVCIPWMLVPKPIIEVLLHSRQHKHTSDADQLQPVNPELPVFKKSKDKKTELMEQLREELIRKEKEKELRKKQLNSRDLSESPDDPQIQSEQQIQVKKSNPQHHDDDEEEFDAGEIFVHQIIETIEFVLGAISNTASYLRLWALSLAHGQLAKVFFEKCLGGGIEEGNFFFLFIGWPVFMHCTVFVLLCMDLMECFLHALRLQWVEFQGKFYKADGIKFIPLSFVEAIQSAQ